MGNLCRFHDIKYDSDFHVKFTAWLKKKEIKWGINSTRNNYHIASQITLDNILKSLDKLPINYRIFGLFVLSTGLRTEEAIVAFNNHSKICRDGVMELFWDRKTKKTNAVFCHPKLHDKIHYIINKSGLKRNMKSSILGCELRYLRKLNYTLVATKIDPLLAEFMQGRRGNISQRHYFLPLMKNNYSEWNSNANPLESFIENWIVHVDGGKKGIKETHAFYKYKMEEMGEKPLNIRQFGREFEVYFEQGKNNGERFWIGIDFKEPIQTTF